MTRAFVLTPAATRDIDEILTYILEHSGQAHALRVHGELCAGLAKVGAQPNLFGHIREDLADESLRVFAVFSYLIIYRPQTEPVQIIRAIHGARDVPTALNERA
jgi:plasmid stabilization system protein ParE